MNQVVLCGLIDSLPPGVDFLLGKDLSSLLPIQSDAQNFVVTRSMTKQNVGRTVEPDQNAKQSVNLKIDEQAVGDVKYLFKTNHKPPQLVIDQSPMQSGKVTTNNPQHDCH